MLENSIKGPDYVKLLKKRKRKPKNKYKELNLQQRRAAGIIDDDISKEHDSQSATKTLEVKNDIKKCEPAVKVGEKTKKRNKKRKLSEHQKSSNDEQFPRKKQKLSDTGNDTDSKKKNVSKHSKALVEIQPQSESTRVGSKFNCKKLRMVLEKSKNVEQNAKTLATEANETKSLPIKKKKLKESPVKAKSLRERVMEKLASARFRYINENLYNMTSKEAVNMFNEDVEAFKVYHEGYSAQVDKWPVNPVDIMIEFIDSRWVLPSYLSRTRIFRRPHILSLGWFFREGNLVVADFGCGEAKIARSVRGKTVHSFDLVALNEHVTVCDISKVVTWNLQFVFVRF